MGFRIFGMSIFTIAMLAAAFYLGAKNPGVLGKVGL